MNVCFFAGDITRCGGTERVTVQVASALASMPGAYTVSIVSLMEEAGTPFFHIPGAIRRAALLKNAVSPIHRAFLRYPAVLRRLVRFLREHRVDVLVDADGVLDVFSLAAKPFAPVKVVTWEHFQFHETLGRPYRLYIKKLAARFSDAFVVLTEETRADFVRSLRPRCPVVCIYNPQDMDGSARYGVDSKTILSVGRLDAIKGFDMLVEVAALVLPRHDGWRWVIAGDGAERENLARQIDRLGLTGRVVLAGSVRDIDDCYRAAALFVLTSRSEGFALVLAEAKRHRLPVVSFACKSGPEELILDGENGYLIPCFDLPAMADKINALIGDADLRARFSARAQDDTEKLGYPAVMERWNSLLSSLCGGAPPHSGRGAL